MDQSCRQMKKENSPSTAQERRRIEEKWYSSILFEWLNPILKKGRAGTLTDEDMPLLALKDCSEALETKLQPYLEAVAAYRLAPNSSTKPNLMRYIYWIFQKEMFALCASYTFTYAAMLFRPILIQEMIFYVQKNENYVALYGNYHGFLIAGLLLLNELFKVTIQSFGEQTQFKTQVQATCMLSTAIWKKSNHLSLKSRKVSSHRLITSSFPMDEFSVW